MHDRGVHRAEDELWHEAKNQHENEGRCDGQPFNRGQIGKAIQRCGKGPVKTR